MGTMYDSTNADDIPSGAEIVAGYIDGGFDWSVANWERFSDAQKIRITVTASNLQADVLDVENGDASPGQAAEWVRQSVGLKIVYHSKAVDVPGVERQL